MACHCLWSNDDIKEKLISFLDRNIISLSRLMVAKLSEYDIHGLGESDPFRTAGRFTPNRNKVTSKSMNQ